MSFKIDFKLGLPQVIIDKAFKTEFVTISLFNHILLVENIHSLSKLGIPDQTFVLLWLLHQTCIDLKLRIRMHFGILIVIHLVPNNHSIQ